MTQVPLIQGHIGFEYKGDHSLTETYNKLNWVRGTDGAYVYIAEEPSLGSPQTDLTKWAVLSRDGTNGTNGVDGRDGVDGTSASLLDTFKVGYVYISLDATSPASLIGGTWASIDVGRFLVSAGSGYAAGATGGSASVALTVAQMPSHQHNLAYWPSSAAAGSNAWIVNVGYESPVYTSSSSVRPTGGGAAHENRPPYYAVYMWRRTA